MNLYMFSGKKPIFNIIPPQYFEIGKENIVFIYKINNIFKKIRSALKVLIILMHFKKY